MKKLLIGTAIVSAALTSCVSDESGIQTQSAQKILFDSPVMYSNLNTRANIYGEIGNVTDNGVNYSYPKVEQFMIYAISHTTDFSGWENGEATAFNATAIAYDGSVDGWAPKTADGNYYYWENGKKMSFAACSPADLEQSHWNGADKRFYGSDGLIIPDFKVSADASKQYDLLFSTRACNNTSASMAHNANYYSGLPVKFQHALSSIRFSISNTSVETVVLTGIKIDGVKYSGTFSENIVENTSDPTLYDRTSDTRNVTPEWTVNNELIANPYVAFEGNITFLESARYVSQLVSEANDPANVCNQLLLMPQELSESSVLEVHYTVNGKANSKVVNLRGLKSSKEVDGQKVETAINSWEIGKRYTYRLTYSSETASRDKIYFSPETSEWQDVDVIVVEL